MKRHLILSAVALLSLAACENSAKEQQLKADQAQQKANEQAAQAEREANQKIANAQREADEKAARANTEAEHDIAKGQAKANEEIRKTNQDVVKQRTDFQVTAQKSVNELDDKIDEMKVKAQKASAQAKADFDSAMQVVNARRATLDSDLKSVGNQTGQAFDSFKAKVDKEIDDLKKSIDDARKKL